MTESSGSDRVRRPAAARRQLRADREDLGAGPRRRQRRSGQRVRPDRAEDLPGRQRLDQGRPHPGRGRQSRAARLAEHVLRAHAREQREPCARHARRAGGARRQPADVVVPRGAQRRLGDGRVLAQRSEGPAGADWVTLAPTPNIDEIMPAADGPRYVGAYGGNGSVTASFDYIRITPDEAECEEDAPVTTAALDPGVPGPGGTYGGAVTVTSRRPTPGRRRLHRVPRRRRRVAERRERGRCRSVQHHRCRHRRRRAHRRVPVHRLRRERRGDQVGRLHDPSARVRAVG